MWSLNKMKYWERKKEVTGDLICSSVHPVNCTLALLGNDWCGSVSENDVRIFAGRENRREKAPTGE